MTSYAWESGHGWKKTKDAKELEHETLVDVRDGIRGACEKGCGEKAGTEKRQSSRLRAIGFGGAATFLWRFWLATAVAALLMISLMQARAAGDMRSAFARMQSGPPNMSSFEPSSAMSGMPMGGSGFPAIGNMPFSGFAGFPNSR